MGSDIAMVAVTCVRNKLEQMQTFSFSRSSLDAKLTPKLPPIFWDEDGREQNYPPNAEPIVRAC